MLEVTAVRPFRYIGAVSALGAFAGAFVLVHPVVGQSSGNQTGTGHPTTDPATPMQQQPSGTAPGSAATQMSDQQFVQTAASANRFEVLEGELAIARAGDSQLKEFAGMMVKDHTTALEELKAAAKAAGISLPADFALEQGHQAKINAMRNRKGADFDQAYRTDQVQAHQQSIALLDSYVTSGRNSTLKQWAAGTLPSVRRHFEHLQSLGMGSGSR